MLETHQLLQCNEGGKSVMFASSCATSAGYFIPVTLVYPLFIKSDRFILDSRIAGSVPPSGCNPVTALVMISGCLASHCCSSSCPVSLGSMAAEDLAHAVTIITITSAVHKTINIARQSYSKNFNESGYP